MSILKIPPAMAALLFMSVSAQAMEFANRPGLVSEALTSASAIHATPSKEHLRRQINDYDIKLEDRPMSISNLNRAWVVQSTFQTRPGRLSDEFSVVAKSSRMRFEYGPGEASSWLKSNATPIVMKFAHHLGPIGNLFPPLAAENIKFADHGFTSSLTKINISSEIEPGKGPAGFCVGSMAPCSSLNSEDRSRIGIF